MTKWNRGAWKLAIERKDGPSALIFSRQNLAQQPRSAEQVANIAKGGYILKDSDGKPELILIATGSEVELAVKAAEQLTAEGKKVRVVSMPSPMHSTNKTQLTVKRFCHQT